MNQVHGVKRHVQSTTQIGDHFVPVCQVVWRGNQESG